MIPKTKEATFIFKTHIDDADLIMRKLMDLDITDLKIFKRPIKIITEDI